MSLENFARLGYGLCDLGFNPGQKPGIFLSFETSRPVMSSGYRFYFPWVKGLERELHLTPFSTRINNE
jgi:hypothetical protein